MLDNVIRLTTARKTHPSLGYNQILHIEYGADHSWFIREHNISGVAQKDTILLATLTQKSRVFSPKLW